MAPDMHNASSGGVMQKWIVLVVAGAVITLPIRLRAADGAIVAVGCVNRAAQNGSMTGTAVAAPAAPDTAGPIANSATLTNQFMLNGATPPDATNAQKATATAGQTATTPGAPASYVLDAARAQLEPHVGHLVEVTGTLLPLAGT